MTVYVPERAQTTPPIIVGMTRRYHQHTGEELINDQTTVAECVADRDRMFGLKLAWIKEGQGK